MERKPERRDRSTKSTGEINLYIIDQPLHHCVVLPFVVLSFSSVT